MVDVDKAIGTAAGIIGAGILAGAGLASIVIPLEIAKNILTPDKKSKSATKKIGDEESESKNSMIDNWEKTWME